MIVGISMVKDEADIVQETVHRMLGQVDRVIVADNGSTDGTLEILYHMAEIYELDVLEDCDPAYYQSRKMTALAAAALDAGADWVVPFDADEVWVSRTGGTIADALRALPGLAAIARADLFDHVPTALDGGSHSPVGAMRWRRTQANPLPKVACRARPDLTIEQGNHGAHFDDIRHPLAVNDVLLIHHFPYRSAEQMIRKARNGAAAYAATDLPEDVGKHWRDYGRLSDEQIHEVFRTYFWSADPIADGLVDDPA